MSENNKIIIDGLKKEPPTGIKVEISRKTGLAYTTILKFFQGKKLKDSTNEKILDAVTMYYSELKQKEQSYIDRIKSIV